MYSNNIVIKVITKIRMILLIRKFDVKPRISDILISELNQDYRYKSMRFACYDDKEINLVILNEYFYCNCDSRLFLSCLRDAKFLYYNMGYPMFDKNYDILVHFVNKLEFIKL